MHLGDALISSAVGCTLWGSSIALMYYSLKQIKIHEDRQIAPLMGVLGAFVFAAQMINFTIPGTGSSGHLGGGLLLACILRPPAAFITIASVLFIQAVFFADGGLLATGCNIFNLGFFPCYIAYPFIYKLIVGQTPSRGRIFWGSFLASVVGLQLGAFAVVVETMFSGISALSFDRFVLLMQPIHLAIGCVEGLITGFVLMALYEMQPSLLNVNESSTTLDKVKKSVLAFLGIAALLIGGVISWYASSHPDGLEWSIEKVVGSEIEVPKAPVYETLAQVQEQTAFLPDYALTSQEGEEGSVLDERFGTSLSGLVGGGFLFAILLLMGLFLKKRSCASVQ